MQRLLVVYNPNSSQYVHVKAEVLARVNELAGTMVGKFAISKIGFDANVKKLARVICDGDVVMAAGGDATAAITANAILHSDKKVEFMVLPYGNFNDLARTLGYSGRGLSVSGRVLPLSSPKIFSEEKSFGDPPSSVARPKPISRSFYPLEIYVDGEFWRYATCYVTIGMTAEAVPIFDDPKIRKKMQEGHKSSWRSYLQLVKWYFKNRRKKEFLPRFSLNGVLQKKGMSDYAAVNGKSMSRVMKGGEDYLKKKEFRSMTEKTVSFLRLFVLMAKSIFVRVPGHETNGDVLEFVEPATVSLQAEGEYQTFENIKKIEVKKGKKCLKVIENR